MKKINNLNLSILAIGIVLIVGLSLVSAGNLFGGNRDNQALNDGTGNGGFLSNIFGGNSNNENTNGDNSAPALQEYNFESYGVDLDSLEWDVNPPVWHSADEIKIKVDDGNYYSLQEALDHGLIRLPAGNIPEGVLLDFTLPKGGPEWYDKVCPSGYGRNKQDQYADYTGEFTITNPFIYEGGVYDFSCSVGDKPGTVVTKVLLNESYNVIVSVKEPRIERIAKVLGEKEIENGKDTYSYLVALEGNKLKFRITRPSSCRNVLLDSINVCAIKNILGKFTDKKAELLTPGYSDQPIAQSTGTSCGDGTCSGNERNMGTCIKDCGGSSTRTGTANSKNTNSKECKIETIDLPNKICKNDQCPVYTVRSGILGGFKEKEIYKWQELKCSVKVVY